MVGQTGRRVLTSRQDIQAGHVMGINQHENIQENRIQPLVALAF